MHMILYPLFAMARAEGARQPIPQRPRLGHLRQAHNIHANGRVLVVLGRESGERGVALTQGEFKFPIVKESVTCTELRSCLKVGCNRFGSWHTVSCQ